MKIVLDTNVLVAALRSNQGASYQLLRKIAEVPAPFTILISVPIFLEYEEVLKRHSTGILIGLDDIDAVLDMIAAKGKEVKLYYLWRPLLPDPGDDMVLELAIAGGADAIVTFNTRDFEPHVRQFGLKTMRPRDLWLQL
jgi:putative PIN family toxin of toxin-antitoxin system